MRRRYDWIEQACRDWGAERRRVLGIDQEERPWRQIGNHHCTLAEVRRLQHNAGASGGKVEQRWPEVYDGFAATVHRAWQHMPEHPRTVFEIHYITRAPTKLKAESLEISQSEYHQRLAAARAAVTTVLEMARPGTVQ